MNYIVKVSENIKRKLKIIVKVSENWKENLKKMYKMSRNMSLYKKLKEKCCKKFLKTEKKIWKKCSLQIQKERI